MENERTVVGMAEYIKLESAVALADFAAEIYPYRVAGEAETYRQYNEGWNDACDYISEHLETAKDILHIRVGSWIQCNGYVECSECNTIGSPHWKCCPVCTAMMDLEEEHDQRRSNSYS